MQPLIIALSLLLAGCSSLLVREDDSGPLVATKVFWRTVLGISTLGISELNLANHRDEYNVQQKLEEYREHLTYQVNNGNITQSEAEELYQQHAVILMQDAREQAQRRIEPLNALATGLGAGLGIAAASAPHWKQGSYPRLSYRWRHGSSYPRLSKPRLFPKSRSFSYGGARRWRR